MCFALSFIYLHGQLGDTNLFLVLHDSLVFRESSVKTVIICATLSFIYLLGQLGDTYLFLVLRDSLVFRESGVKTVIIPT